MRRGSGGGDSTPVERLWIAVEGRDETTMTGKGQNSGAPNPEVLEKPKRRKFSAQYKLHMLQKAAACTRLGEVGALLRQEGLHSSHLSEWRRAQREGALGALSKKRGRKPQRDGSAREIERLQKENRRLQDKLRQAEAIIDIQKKISEILGVPPRTAEDDGSGS